MRRFFAWGIFGLALVAGQAQAAFGLDAYLAIDINGWGRAVAIGDVNGDGRKDIVVVKSPSDAAGAGEFKVYVFYQGPDGALSDPRIYGLPDEVNANALALADLNGDGTQDIVIGHYAGITLLTTSRPRPELKRTEINVGRGTNGVRVVDVDGDRNPDVIAQGDGNAPTVYFGDGMGNIRATRAITAITDGYSLDVADLNRDGKTDLVATDPWTGTILALLHNSQDWFNSTVSVYDPGYPTDDVNVGDFNGDGRKDIVTRNAAGTLVSIFHRNPTGTPYTSAATMQTAASPNALAVGDLDGDGLDDLLVQHTYAGLGYYLQGAAGLANEVLQPSTTGGSIAVAGMAIGDVNGDGCQDVAIGDYLRGLVILHGHGCIVRPDLSLAAASTSSTLTLNVANSPGTESLNAPLLRLDLSVREGTLVTGALPSGCVVQSQSASAQHIDCLLATLSAGAKVSLSIPYSATGNSHRSRLAMAASASTDTIEKTLANNQASIVQLLH